MFRYDFDSVQTSKQTNKQTSFPCKRLHDLATGQRRLKLLCYLRPEKCVMPGSDELLQSDKSWLTTGKDGISGAPSDGPVKVS